MITIYSKPNCPYCDQAKLWMDRNSMEYETIDVTQDEKALVFLKTRGHKSVPQIYMGDIILIDGGFTGLQKIDREELMKRMGKC